MGLIEYFIAISTVIGIIVGAFAKVRKIEKAFDEKIKAAIKDSKLLEDRINAQIRKYAIEEGEKRDLRAQKYDQQFKDHAEEVSRFIKKLTIIDGELNGPDGIYSQMGQLKTDVHWLKGSRP